MGAGRERRNGPGSAPSMTIAAKYRQLTNSASPMVSLSYFCELGSIGSDDIGLKHQVNCWCQLRQAQSCSDSVRSGCRRIHPPGPSLSDGKSCWLVQREASSLESVAVDSDLSASSRRYSGCANQYPHLRLHAESKANAEKWCPRNAFSAFGNNSLSYRWQCHCQCATRNNTRVTLKVEMVPDRPARASPGEC